MTAEQAAAILQAVENLERQQRREQARARARAKASGGEGLVRSQRRATAAAAASCCSRSLLLGDFRSARPTTNSEAEGERAARTGPSGRRRAGELHRQRRVGGLRRLARSSRRSSSTTSPSSRGPFQSQSQRWVNGTTSSSVQLTWRLRPSAVGPARVRAIRAPRSSDETIGCRTSEIQVQAARRRPGAKPPRRPRRFDPFEDLFGRGDFAGPASSPPAVAARPKLFLRAELLDRQHRSSASRPSTLSGSIRRPTSAPFSPPPCPTFAASGCGRFRNPRSSGPSGSKSTASASAACRCCGGRSFLSRRARSRSSRPRSTWSRPSPRSALSARRSDATRASPEDRTTAARPFALSPRAGGRGRLRLRWVRSPSPLVSTGPTLDSRPGRDADGPLHRAGQPAEPRSACPRAPGGAARLPAATEQRRAPHRRRAWFPAPSGRYVHRPRDGWAVLDRRHLASLTSIRRGLSIGRRPLRL